MYPELPPPTKIWYILAPWKYTKPWARIVGSYCLFCMALSVTGLFWSNFRFWAFAVLPAYGVLFILFGIDMFQMSRDKKRWAYEDFVIFLWAGVIDGQIKMEDLPPRVQEDIARQRAKVYTTFPPREDEQ
jgi:hypothetical protein